MDILVVNAGIFVIEPFESTTLASWQRPLTSISQAPSCALGARSAACARRGMTAS